MPPPPPPAPPPPPPPTAISSPAGGPLRTSPGKGGKAAPVADRGRLLSEIHTGIKLKKAVTNDKSKPAIGGAGAGRSPPQQSGGGGHATSVASAAAALAASGIIRAPIQASNNNNNKSTISNNSRSNTNLPQRHQSFAASTGINKHTSLPVTGTGTSGFKNKLTGSTSLAPAPPPPPAAAMAQLSGPPPLAQKPKLSPISPPPPPLPTSSPPALDPPSPERSSPPTSTAAGDMSALLSEIRTGARLKKASAAPTASPGHSMTTGRNGSTNRSADCSVTTGSNHSRSISMISAGTKPSISMKPVLSPSSTITTTTSSSSQSNQQPAQSHGATVINISTGKGSNSIIGCSSSNISHSSNSLTNPATAAAVSNVAIVSRNNSTSRPRNAPPPPPPPRMQPQQQQQYQAPSIPPPAPPPPPPMAQVVTIVSPAPAVPVNVAPAVPRHTSISKVDLEARFALQFRDFVTLPVPEAMNKVKKVYPSVIQKQQKRCQAPAPPPPPPPLHHHNLSSVKSSSHLTVHGGSASGFNRGKSNSTPLLHIQLNTAGQSITHC